MSFEVAGAPNATARKKFKWEEVRLVGSVICDKQTTPNVWPSSHELSLNLLVFLTSSRNPKTPALNAKLVMSFYSEHAL